MPTIRVVDIIDHKGGTLHRVSILRTLLAVALVVQLMAPLSAAANTISRSDGNDTRGRLDLASLRITHKARNHVVRLATRGPFTNGQIDGDHGHFELDIDVNGDRRFDYLLFIWHDGRMRAAIVYRTGRILTRTKAWRTGNSVSAVQPLSEIGKPRSYDVGAASVSRTAPCTQDHPCVDTIPNRYPLLRHDLTAPRIRMDDLSPLSSDFATTTTIPVSFAVSDDRHGSGIDRWRLQRRPAGSSSWTTVKVGSRRSPTVGVPTEEGRTYDIRVIASDRQGNKAISQSATTTVPYDDANAFFTYSGTWTAETGLGGPFQGTLHSGTPSSTVSFDVVNAKQVCIIGGPVDNAYAAVWINGVYRNSIFEDGYTKVRQVLDCWSFGGGDAAMMIEVTGVQNFKFDGVSVTHP